VFEFAWPWMFAVSPLPLLVRRFLPPVRAARAALRLPDLKLLPEIGGGGEEGSGRGRLGLAALAWILLVTAAARPQWVGEPMPLPQEGRDLLLAVDLSGSMAERDFVVEGFRTDRLTATKAVVSDFLERRKGDRVGLILFGDRAYLHVPLTRDLATVRRLLNEAFIKMAGEKTAIGDAIGLAVKRLQVHEGDKVLILVSDGENTAGAMDPLQAARLARDAGVRIYTIGIGSEGGRGPFGLPLGGRLDEKRLRAIAEITGGRYYRATDTQGLAEIYREIDALEPVARGGAVVRPVEAWFHFPLGAALLIAFGLLYLETRS